MEKGWEKGRKGEGRNRGDSWRNGGRKGVKD